MSLEDQYDAWVRSVTGGRRYSSASKQESDAARDSLNEMQAQLDALGAAQKRQKSASDALDAVQRASAATADSVRRMSNELTQTLRQDGLLGGKTAQPVPVPAQESKPDAAGFNGLADRVRSQVLGQDAFVGQVVKAFRRPFVMGTADAAHARGSMLLCGPRGTGRHYALTCIVDEMAGRGLLKSNLIETMDLSLYPGPAQEKLFLQDLYAALQSSAEVLAFDHYESCAANYLNMLATLAIDGTLPLTNRYVLQRGILVEVGTALAPGAIGELQAAGKYFVFFSEKGESALADRFGARFVDALEGDICKTEPFTPESLAAIAARELNHLAQRVRALCGLALTMGADVRDLVAGQYGKTSGMTAMREYVDGIYRALAEYVLDAETVPAPGTAAKLTVQEGRLMAAVGGGEPFDLLALLPRQYRGDVEAVEAELDAIVGLAARVLAKYLKAIGALRGGQLVEVSRADLVGRYVGHTAPLTNQVIQSALGGVLFIDEAYSLYRGREDSFGLEAIDTLVKGIEAHRNDLVVSLAGYSKEMSVFLTANPWLASRFPKQIDFPDYTGTELLSITKSIARGKGYTLDESCCMPLTAYYDRKQAEDAASNGNGRMARNTLEKAILNQSKRLIADPGAPLELLLPGDFELEE